MHGHHHHPVGVFIVVVDVGDQGHFLQKARQSGFLAFLVGVGAHAGHQLTQVFQPCLAFLALGFQHGLVAGEFQHLGGELVQGFLFQDLPQPPDQGVEFAQGGGSPAQFGVFPGPAGYFQHAALAGGGDGCHLVHRGRADLAGGFVDDPPQPQVILAVGHHREVGNDVLYLLAVVEPLAAHDLVRDARTGKIGFDGARLGVHAVEHRVVFQLGAIPEIFADDPGHILGLVGLALRFKMVDPGALAVFGPEGLALAAPVVADDAVGGVENIGGGAVVLLQSDHLGAGEVLLKAENIFDGGAPEPIDTLVVVAHHTDVLVHAAQQIDQLELGHAGVLVLVHEDIFEPIPVILAALLALLQKAHSVVDEVVKVHGAGPLEPLLVSLVHLGNQTGPAVGGGLQSVLGADHLVFQPPDGTQAIFQGQELLVHRELLIHLFHSPLLVVGVVDGKALGEPQPLGLPAQNPHTGRVEGGGVDVASHGGPQHLGQTVFQLAGGLVGKGDGQHVPGTHGVVGQHLLHLGGQGCAGNGGLESLAVGLGGGPGQPFAVVGPAEADHIGDAVHQHGGLAASGAGQNQQRALGVEHRLFLHGVQPPEAGLDILFSQLEKLPVVLLHSDWKPLPVYFAAGQPAPRYFDIQIKNSIPQTARR